MERIGSQALQYFFIILLSRELSPNDFGLFALVVVFTSLAQVFVDGGMMPALIRLGNPSEKHFSAALSWNLFIAAVAATLIVGFSEPIALFFDQPKLQELLKLSPYILIFFALGIVQRARAFLSLRLKNLFFMNVIAIFLSGMVALIVAKKGYGVWALVVQQALNVFFLSIFLWAHDSWKPTISKMTFKALTELQSFGLNIMLASFIDVISKNIIAVVIGKNFSPTQLGYYSQAQKLTELPSGSLTQTIQQVNFPKLSKSEDLISKRIEFSKAISLGNFVIFPVMMAVSVLSEDLLLLILGPQWLGASDILALLSLAVILNPWHAINLNLLQVQGYSKYYLKLEIIKKSMLAIVVILTLKGGVEAMCLGLVFLSILSAILNSSKTSDILDINHLSVFSLLIPAAFCSMITIFIAEYIQIQFQEPYLRVISVLILGAIIYLSTYRILFKKNWFLVMSSFN